MSASSYIALQKQMAELSRSLRPSFVDEIQRMEKVLEPLRQQHLAFVEQVKAANAITRFAEIADANKRLLASFDRIKLDTRLIDDVARVHDSWLRDIRCAEERMASLQASAKLSLAMSSQITTAAERLHASFDFDRLRSTLRVHDDIVANFQARFGAMTRTFDGLAQSVESFSALTALPRFVMPSASREVLLVGRSVADLFREDIEVADDPDAELFAGIRDDLSGVGSLLSQINPSLAAAYQGAREAMAGASVDRGRHVLASLRETWSHLLRMLAPDEKVIPWLGEKAHELVHDGRPTRKARILYLCQGINHGPLTEFVAADTGALVKLIEVFNRIHQLEPALTGRQLNALLLRSDSWLTFIIQISKEGQQC